MPMDTKKVLMTVFSVGLFLIVFFGIALALFYPKNAPADAPASIGNTAPARIVDPGEYLRTPPPAPIQEQPATSGNIVIVYGEKPEPSPAVASDAQAAGALPTAVEKATPTTATTTPQADATATSTATTKTTPTATAKITPTAAAKTTPPATAKATPTATAKATPTATAKATPPATAKATPTAAAKATPPAAAATSGNAAKNVYWIQAASFSTRSRAEDLKKALAEKGLASTIVVKDIDGKSYFRVRIGPYVAHKEAEGWLSRIKGFPGCDEAYVAKM